MGSNILATTTGSIAEIEKGAKGATERPRPWVDIPDGSAIESGTGDEQWIDIVLYGDGFYQCVRSFTKGNGVVPTNTIYFKPITDYKRLATGLFLARKAYIHNLGVDNILITDQGEGKGNVLLQADKDGIVCKSGNFENVKIVGSTRVPFTLASSGFDVDYSDNVVLISDGSGWSQIMGNNFSIKWTPDQSGRRITLVNFRWNEEYAEGYGRISAIDGCYFYEDGLKKTKLIVSREAVELLGYGTPDTFYGWIVLNRVYIGTNYLYGHSSHVLAYAHITGKQTSDTGTVTMKQLTFDNRKMSITYDDEGMYTLTLPNQWFKGLAGDAIISITSRGAPRIIYIRKSSGSNLSDSIQFVCGYYDAGRYTHAEAEFDISICSARDLNFLVDASDEIS